MRAGAGTAEEDVWTASEEDFTREEDSDLLGTWCVVDPDVPGVGVRLAPQAYATDALGTSADAAAGLLLTICGRASCRESDFVGRTRGLAGDMSR